MKKLSLLLILSLLSIFSYSQVNNAVDIGTSYINIKELNSPYYTFKFGLYFKNFYFDMGSNFYKGNGNELDKPSMKIYKNIKAAIYIVNIGYKIELTKRLYFIPIIGHINIREIYQDNKGWNTWFYGDVINKLNFGANVNYYFSKHIGIIIGSSTVENFKISISIRNIY
jgi:hypothetical protein